MDYLRAKSEFNLESAKVLIDDYSYFAPSIHCSYYGCFQYIKSKLNQIGITYEKIDIDIAASRQAGGKTLHSHMYPINLLLNEVEKKSGGTARKTISDKIKLLKIAREESDYHNIEIKHGKSTAALSLSREIIKLINTYI